jgi:hypothetical protein
MLFSVVLAALACAGCGISKRERAPVAMPEPLAWLQAGTTERAQLRECFGEPSQTFEDGRIQTWKLNGQLQCPERFEDHPFCLVVVFEGAGRVQRASLVRTR